MYIGDDLLIKTVVSNPLTGAVAHATSTVTVAAYDPGKAPTTSETDRGNPDHITTLSYDATQNAHLGRFSTTGWVAGTWTLLVAVTGDLAGHAYTTVPLVAG